MWFETALTRRLKVRYPIIQAPMAGGPTTPELVAAVSAAGAIGALGAGYMKPEAIGEAIRRIRALTSQPFCVNLFVPQPFEVDRARVERSIRLLAPIRRALGLLDPPIPSAFSENFYDQVAVCIEHRVPIFSFTFGIPEAEVLTRLREAGIVTIGTATTVAEACALEKAGVDMICAQGAEAGGHRGSFLRDPASSMVGTMALVPQVVDAVNVPVIASGGIMDGRGLAAALALGASGVQCGSAFLRCHESGAPAPYKQAIGRATDDGTAVTRAFSGRLARGLENTFIKETNQLGDEWPPYPVQNALTRDIRNHAAKIGDPEFMSLWAGQAAALAKEASAAEIIEAMVAQAEQIFTRLAER